MGLHVISTPTGRFIFAGSVPGSLAYVHASGRAATAKELETARRFGPRLAGVKTRSWATRAEAVAAAAALGLEVAE